MTNEEKAKKIAEKNGKLKMYLHGMELGGVCFDALPECCNSAMEMAEWKDQQFAEEKKQWIEKAHDWLIKNSSKYVGFDENQFLAYAYKTMSDDFIKYMEE